MTNKYFLINKRSIATLITVGYGDIHPYNKREVVYTIFTMLIGSAIFAFNINALGSIIQDILKN